MGVAGDGENKLVFSVMHLSNSPLAACTCEYAFVVET